MSKPEFDLLDQISEKEARFHPSKRSKSESEDLFGEEKVRSHFHKAAVFILWFGTFMLCAVLAVRFWHFVAPDHCRWLSTTDIQSLDKVLFSSAFGGVVINYIQRVMIKNTK